jgi:hypothetical protein
VRVGIYSGRSKGWTRPLGFLSDTRRYSINKIQDNRDDIDISGRTRRTHSVVSDFPCSLMAVDTDCLARVHQARIFDERVAYIPLSYCDGDETEPRDFIYYCEYSTLRGLKCCRQFMEPHSHVLAGAKTLDIRS